MSEEPTPTPSPAPAPTPTPAPAPAPTPTPAPAPTPTPAPAPASWLGGLTDETLRANEHLSRYQSVDDLAKAHVETVTWARGRVPLPKGDDAKAREDFVSKARPEKPELYEVTVPEGQDASRADAFKATAHRLGLMPWQAKELADSMGAYETDAVSRMQQAAADEITTRKVNLGPAGFERARAAIGNMFEAVEGVDGDAVMAGLESAIGAGPTFDYLLMMAEKTGELEKVSGEDIALALGQLSPEKAQAELTRLDSDAEFFKKAAVKDSPEYKKRAQLLTTIAGG